MLKFERKAKARMWSLRFYDADREELKRIAKIEKLSTSNLIRQVLRDFIRQYHNQKKGVKA
jgi:hypothetical protein